MKLLLRLALIILVLAAIATSPTFAQVEPQGQIPLTGSTGAHDPTLFKHENFYYVARTNSNQLWRASSLGGPWANIGSFPGFYGNSRWAPHAHQVGDAWYIYYSTSSFGTNNSRISVMRSTTPGIPSSWVFMGDVIRSGTMDPDSATHNAIDPAIHQDDEGNWWIVWGSHFDGIMIQRLEDDMITVTGPVTMLAHRGSDAFPVDNPNFNRIEGPSIFKRNNYYYLLTAWDWCCRANGNDNTYKVVVGRSENIDGPYVDKNGVLLSEGGGSIILNSRAAQPGVTPTGLYRAPGGPDIFIEDGVYYMIYHAYRPGTTMAIRPLNWHDDWPYFNEPGGGFYDLRDGAHYYLINQDGIITNPNSLQNPAPSNRCLTATAAGDELNVIQMTCANEQEQVWQLHRESDGFYRLRSMISDQSSCLAVADDSGEVGVNVLATPCDTGDTTLQEWYFDDTGHGFHRPVVKQANLALEIQNDNGVVATNVLGGYRRDGTHQAGNLEHAGKWPPQQWRFVMDSTPPTLQVDATPSSLWPPNHQLVTIQVAIHVSDDMDPNPQVTLLSVTSNEPDSGLSPDDVPNDIVIIDDQTIQLRAERDEDGDGRVYTLIYEATDATGNSATAETIVTVPHDQRSPRSFSAEASTLEYRTYLPALQE